MSIPMQHVDSSNIEAVGYDEDSSLLVIEFKSGAVYEYEAVPKEVYEELMDAESVGKTFNRLVKTAYAFNKVS